MEERLVVAVSGFLILYDVYIMSSQEVEKRRMTCGNCQHIIGTSGGGRYVRK